MISHFKSESFSKHPMSLQKAVFALVLPAIFALFLGGCVSVPNVDADRATTSRIKKITLLAIPAPREIPVANLGGAAGAFGLVGGLVQAGVNSSHAKQFAGYLASKKIDLAHSLEDAVIAALKEDGFEVMVDRNQKPKLAPDGKSDDFSNVQVDADAILSVWSVSIGYISPPNSSHYEPSGIVKVRLLDAKTKTDLYYKTFVIGWKLPMKESIYLETDDEFRYKSIEEFTIHEDEAVQGLFAAQKLVAQKIKTDLGIH